MAAINCSTRYSDLCRICATKTNMILGINIFANEGLVREIDKKIESCLPIQIHENDELPKMMCEQCVYKLELFYDFRERSVRTEALLIDLLKEEIDSARIQNEHQLVKISQSIDMVGNIDHTDLIMVPHHQLLAQHGIQTVNELDLPHLEHRNSMIVEHEIILANQNVDINAHSLDSIDLNHHDLAGQDLSNHSIQAQEILVDNTNGVHNIQNSRYTEENLELMHQQHQLLTQQYRLQQHLQVEMSDSNMTAVEDSESSRDVKDSQSLEEEHISQVSNINKIQTVTQECHDSSDSHHEKVLQTHLVDQDETKTEMLKHEDSNSENRLLIDDRLSDVHNTSSFMLDIDKSFENGVENQDWYFCNMCGKTIEQKEEFEEHFAKHFFKCEFCYAVFNNETTLNEHRKTHPEFTKENAKTKTRLKHSAPPLPANETKEEENVDDPGAADVNDDVKDEEDEEDEESSEVPDNADGKRRKWSPKVCKDCGKTYKSNYKLTEHMRQHTGEKPYKCSSCEKAFRSKIGLAQHEAKHTGQYDFACPTCGKGFQCKSYLMVHQRVHSDLKPYPCTTCGRNFKTKQSLLDHTNRHLGVKPYMCETCGRGFITKGLCKAHQKIHTGTDNRKYSCKVCNKMFVSKSYLQTHLRIHTGEKPFMCEVCGKGFLTRVDLRIHSTMHTGEKSYVCEMCGKAFARRDALRCHRRSHTGERPYSCDQCGQTFTQFSPMAIHKRLHTGERPYSCEVCGKSFVSRSTMMSHSKKHVR